MYDDNNNEQHEWQNESQSQSYGNTGEAPNFTIVNQEETEGSTGAYNAHSSTDQSTYNAENSAEQNTYNSQYTSQNNTYSNTGYTSQSTNEQWHPDSNKYNTYSEPQVVTKTEKKRTRWWIPVTIVLAAMVVIITVGAIIGINALRNWVRQNPASTESIAIAGTAEPETAASTSAAPIESSAGNATGSFFITDVSDVVDEIMPAVVSITSRALVNTGNYWNYFFGGGFGGNSGSTEEVPAGIGSGTIIGQNNTELLILTSYHVVEGSSSLYVTFNDEASVDGYIKSASEENDIAIVAVPLADISDETVKAIKIASLCTDEPAVGDGAIVIGNALGYGQSVTTGIVSAKERTITVEGKTLSVLQTNAAINNGNSGGCLLNAAGQVIGISEAKVNTNAATAGVEGMCYAIPIYSNLDLITELMNAETKAPEKSEEENGVQQSSNGAFLGIYGRDIDSELAESYNLVEGVYIIGVTSGGGAQKAGLQEGDIIVAVDDEDASTMEQLQSILAQHSPGDTVKVKIMRASSNNGEYKEQTMDVTLTGSL